MIHKKYLSAALAAAGLVAGTSLVAGPALADTPSCQDAGTTGLTTAVLAHSGQTISGSIDASGCDIGVYIGPGVTHVVVNQASISNANDHGIFVQDTSNSIIENSEVTGGLGTHAADNGGGIAEDKAIELVGTTHIMVTGNWVHDNNAGGIGVSDDGVVNPGALAPGAALASVNNVIENNTVSGNQVGCGIVVAAYDTGAGVVGNTVAGNTVSTSPAGIVVATDSPGSSAHGNTVEGNTSTHNGLPGIIIHSNTPGDQLSGTVVTGNTVSANGTPGTGWTASGIALVGEVNSVSGTLVADNQVSDEYNGISEINAVGVATHGNSFDNVTVAINK